MKIKIRKMKTLALISTILVTGLLLAGCGNGADVETENDNDGIDATNGKIASAADRDIEMPGGMADRVPFPETLSTGYTHVEDDGNDVTISTRLRTQFRDVIADVEAGLAEYGWEIIESNLPDETDEGEIGADWTAELEGLNYHLSLTAFGGTGSSNGGGSLRVRMEH